MSQNTYTYFVIPHSTSPDGHPYAVVYGDGAGVVGVTDGQLPEDAIIVGSAIKDPPVPPSPELIAAAVAVKAAAVELEQRRTAFQAVLNTSRLYSLPAS
jgi:hypothetical protein